MAAPKTPFDAAKLDQLMDQADVALLLATSKHNVQYLLGGYRYHFFVHLDAIGLSRYLPVVGYHSRRLDTSFYVGNEFEADQQEVSEPLWVGEVHNACWTSEASALEAADLIRQRGLQSAKIAIERAWIPNDAAATLARELPQAQFVDATEILDELRAVKRPDELAKLRSASELIVESMLAVMGNAKRGASREELLQALHVEEARRGLDFDYCLMSAGKSYNRTPQTGHWEAGSILSLDSGGNKEGYIGDLTRMAVMGTPTSEMVELLAEVDSVQMAARGAIRAGRLGGVIFEAVEEQLRMHSQRDKIAFLAHGMGLTSNEAPRLTSTGMVPYPATHADRPLEAGMVLSIETTRFSSVGLVRLEDTVVVTESGWDAYGDVGRGWNGPVDCAVPD